MSKISLSCSREVDRKSLWKMQIKKWIFYSNLCRQQIVLFSEMNTCFRSNTKWMQTSKITLHGMKMKYCTERSFNSYCLFEHSKQKLYDNMLTANNPSFSFNILLFGWVTGHTPRFVINRTTHNQPNPSFGRFADTTSSTSHQLFTFWTGDHCCRPTICNCLTSYDFSLNILGNFEMEINSAQLEGNKEDIKIILTCDTRTKHKTERTKMNFMMMMMLLSRISLWNEVISQASLCCK